MHQPISIRANWLWTGIGKPQSNACITIHQGRVVSVSSESPSSALDLGSHCILPGLINSHTHLEFSDLKQPVPSGDSFAGWILEVIRRRRLVGTANSATDFSAKQTGLVESGRHGVRLALDVVHASLENSNTNEPLPKTMPQPDSPKTRLGVQGDFERNATLSISGESTSTPTVVHFAELMATTALRAMQTWRAAIELKRQHIQLQLFGLSPHAPYTTTSSLVRQAVKRCNRWKVPIMMHLAESLDELRWTETGDGPLQDLLEMVVGPDALSINDRLSIPGYVHELCQAPLAFIIHGNYLDEHSISILEAHRRHVAVVYCPRTHAHFRHSKYPLKELRHRGIPVILGTDSRASNPDLSVFEEARKVRQLFAEIPADEIMSMLTTQPADLLGRDRDYGYIRAKSLAQLTAIPCHAKKSEDVLEELLSSPYRAQPLEAVVAGTNAD